jgi:hypothetical protein
MRPIADLLDFLTHQMSMQAVYQPVVILLSYRKAVAPF